MSCNTQTDISLSRRISMFKKGAFLAGILILFSILTLSVSAGESTAYTYTISVEGDWIRTQDAYLPGNVYMKGYGLSKPGDLFCRNGLVYIADSGNGRVVVFSPDNGSVQTMGEGILKAPSGVFAGEDGRVYVADPEAEAVFIFSAQGELIRTIGRPESHLFGASSVYKPKNVVCTSDGNLFVVGIGAHEGLMQFDEEGNFYGYFAANKRSLTFRERIEDLIYTREQKDKLLMRTARSIENIAITNRDLIYSVTQSAGFSYSWVSAEKKFENQIKLHNMAGQNILSKDKFMHDEWNFVDVAAGPYGNSYALTQTGLIYEYDNAGNVVFSFGGRAASSDRSGLFSVAAAIDIDENGFLYVLDKERALIQIFYPTDFAVSTHQAIYCLSQGDYSQSEAIWESVLRLNSMSRVAHIGYGRTLLHQQKYAEAMEHFKIAGDREYYSEAFWESRNEWIHSHALYLIGTVFVLALLFYGIKWMKKRRKPKARPIHAPSRFQQLLADIRFLPQMLRHPIDGYYYLKRGEKGSVQAATVIYILMFFVYLLDQLFRGFIFNEINLTDTPLLPIVALYFMVVVLWVIGNSMVSSINDGEGSIKNVYVMTAYSLAPYLLIIPPTVLLSYILTFNEAFIIQFLWIAAVAWTGINLFCGLVETHGYSFRDAAKNIILTLFFMLVAIVALVMLYLIWKQVFTFFEQLCGEVAFRVE